MKKQYKLNKGSKVGDKCICPSCKSEFVKENYQQAFCKTKPKTQCKDYYWNNVTETKRNNLKRISPANRAWQLRQEAKFDLQEYEHPFSSEALGQWN